MALLNLNFTQDEVTKAQSDNFTPIPTGNYVAEVNRSEVKATKDGRGSYLSLSLKVLEGDFAGRLIFQNITLTNANATAQTIGREQMAQLAGACGILNLQDSEQLHGKPIGIRVAIETDKSGQYEPRNTVKKFFPLNSPLQSAPQFGTPAPQGFNAPTAPQAPQGYAQPQAPAQGNPWARQG